MNTNRNKLALRHRKNSPSHLPEAHRRSTERPTRAATTPHGGIMNNTLTRLSILGVSAAAISAPIAFRDWANMDTFPREASDAITATVRERSKTYESGSGLRISNPGHPGVGCEMTHFVD